MPDPSTTDRDAPASPLDTPHRFDKDFIDWWVMDHPDLPDLGEATPFDDLASFRAMLKRGGWAIVPSGGVS